jgi:DNA-binding response OmpR family regulator
MDRVLIVDDDVQLCRLLTERLTSEGFTIEVANDGIRGLERALSMEHALVVLDLMLPGMTGLDVLRKLRARSPVPVLILTARGEDIDRILGLEIGADDYVPKPFNPRELIAPAFAPFCAEPPEPQPQRIPLSSEIFASIPERARFG